MDEPFSWTITFDQLLSRGTFVDDVARMFRVLQDAYQHPVDIEFTANFRDIDDYRINLLQCRPFQAKGDRMSLSEPCSISPERTILGSSGHVIGSSRSVTVDRMVFVDPEVYGQMKMSDRYAVARLIGRLTHLKDLKGRPTIMLVGPGRWATTSPFLGVPVSFSEINTVSILCEVIAMHEGLVPEASLGTHFFNDLVESDMLYCAVRPGKEGSVLNTGFFTSSANRLEELLPDAKELAGAVKVIDTDGLGIRVCSDVQKQRFTCFVDRVDH